MWYVKKKKKKSVIVMTLNCKCCIILGIWDLVCPCDLKITLVDQVFLFSFLSPLNMALFIFLLVFGWCVVWLGTHLTLNKVEQENQFENVLKYVGLKWNFLNMLYDPFELRGA